MDEPLVLSSLLNDARPGKAPIAFRGKQVRTWDDFQSHVAGLCRALQDHPHGRWLLSCDSTYAFGVGLLALWHTGRIAVLPPNQQSESLMEVSAGVKGIISDASFRFHRLPLLSPLSMSTKKRVWKTVPTSRPCLELFTSGSTGSRKVVKKTLAHLQNEIAVLEKTFGARLGSCRVYSTVSHQHIYGLLFRLLWPLSAGRPFTDDTPLLWEELAPRLNQTAATCLVTSPAHLERLTKTAEKAIRKTSLRAIFSSGGPLSQDAVANIRRLKGQAPVEVFGSTETGGVGWRQQNKKLIDWTPFQGVQVSLENRHGLLRIRSPFSSAPQETMGDRGLILKGGAFRLLGRADRIVKVSEKRLSLDDMERRLRQPSWVADAKVILMESPGEMPRASLGAALILNAQGKKHLERDGRSGIVTALKKQLRKSFDPSTLPRAFRFLDAFPIDTQGKVSQPSLASLFHARFNPAVTMPRIWRETKTKSTLLLRLQVPSDLAYLEGHFPDHPVVPGVVQLRWVITTAEQWLRRRLTVQRMEAIKFKNLLLPDDLFSMAIEIDPTENTDLLRFSLQEKKKLYSSGRLVLK